MEKNNELMNIQLTDGKIKSTELVDIINVFREEEGKNPKEHSDFMKKIKKEIETLKSLGLDNEGNFSPVEYIDKKGEKRPCYELTHDGMLEMLNSESVYCRAKTIEYINKLESEIKQLQEEKQPKLPSTYKEALQQLLAQVEENEKLLEENNKISLENQILNGEHFAWVDKSLINAIVRKYGACLGDFGKAWVEFKKNLLYKYSININSRKTLALNNGKSKSKCKTLDMLHGEDEIQKSIMVALSMCNEKDIDVSDVLKHAKDEYEKEN